MLNHLPHEKCIRYSYWWFYCDNVVDSLDSLGRRSFRPPNCSGSALQSQELLQILQRTAWPPDMMTTYVIEFPRLLKMRLEIVCPWPPSSIVRLKSNFYRISFEVKRPSHPFSEKIPPKLHGEWVQCFYQDVLCMLEYAQSGDIIHISFPTTRGAFWIWLAVSSSFSQKARWETNRVSGLKSLLLKTNMGAVEILILQLHSKLNISSRFST